MACEPAGAGAGDGSADPAGDPSGDPGEATALLRRWRAGDPLALDALMPLLYSDLRRAAARAVSREHGQATLQPTALVNEAYLRLLDAPRIDWVDRAHFLAVACRVMRRILVEHGRARAAQKRGGGVLTVTSAEAAVAPRPLDLVALDRALDRLQELDAQQSEIIELRFFGGLSVEEVSEVLGMAPATVKRRWSSARAWLVRELEGEGGIVRTPR
jgi:RNA polymerase sigma factor (TIGR02999 family)